MELFTHQGQSQPTANFDTPVPTGGQAPVNVTCNPGSGTEFQNGTTTVRCEAVDALAQKGSCTFQVVVSPVPRLEKTKFMAFGDSITEGKVTLTTRGVVVVPPGILNEAASYVNQLNSKFEARYLDQTITIIADGYGGERAGDGKLRLERDWPVYNPDALLVMEGVNDLLSPETGTPEGMNAAMNSVIDALRRMIRYAKGRGGRVFVGTLPPMKSPKPENVIAAVPMLNSRIRALVSEENAILADHYAAVPLDLVGSDGLHLKADGYRAMADEWLKQIIATMEVKTSIAR
jgi:lysophospholipase L1-like esterase